ncbi:Homeobox domain-containing protein [Cephalotus follicularis]|uniref:Homeobox domain-containing protein n=1 Tax=Cephalotus follicularis TaxID=3775 RepID=A0A1Q3D6Q8_CEPFO|nr:Homeobox domain-containing protein [Cephalotus follicularis]
MMEWFDNKQQQEQQLQVQMEGLYQRGVGGVLNAGVMTDEQTAMLQKQISVYATICEQLVEMHKHFSTKPHLAGMRFANPYYDPLVASGGGHKISAARQRWSPTLAQLKILEESYEQVRGTPGKQRIKEITTQLTEHGQITETNVYNWFQNRRARAKRKESLQIANTCQSEMEAETKSPQDEVKTVEDSTSRSENMFLSCHDNMDLDQLCKMDLPETLCPFGLLEQGDFLG